MKVPELLAPAGSLSSLYAAVSAGSDAVYLGTESFNARRGASNFSLDDLAAACDYAHLRGVKVYLTLNTLILPGEFGKALELARQAWRRGVDAVIVQDIGLIAETVRVLPDLPVHASTQLNTHTAAGIEALAALGVARITLARELSLFEIAHLVEVADERGIGLEVFVHGALCLCYSGQCYLSSMIGGRSANRGLCAQACRLPYTLYNKAQRKPCAAPGEHLLSPKDLCLVDKLEELRRAGVASLKIEGRMKSPEYVHTVTGVYRKALDGLAGETGVTDHDKRLLAEAFSRGFTTAYFEGDRSNRMMSYTRPNNRGVHIGRVEAVQGRKTTIALSDAVEVGVGDILEFWTNKGNFTHSVAANEATADEATAGKATADEATVGERGTNSITLTLSKSAKKGDRVFRVRRGSLSFSGDVLEPKISVDGSARLRIGSPLRIGVSEGRSGAEVVFEGGVVEAARTKEVTADEVRTHIDRMGNTPFAPAQFDIDIDPGVGISFSALHKARVAALDLLTERMLAPWRQRRLARTERREAPVVFRSKACTVAALATNPSCARAAIKAGAELVYVPALFFKRGEAMIAGQRSQTVEQAGYPKKSIVVLPEVEHDPVPGTREQRLGFDAWAPTSAGKPVVVENPGQLYRAVRLGLKVEAGPHLSVYNAESLRYVCEQGAQRVWLSPELSLEEITALAAASPVPLGLAVLGAQKLMTTEHCLLMSQGPCDENCVACPRRRSPHYLKDRKGYEFPIFTDLCGRSHLYNAVPLDVAHAAVELIGAGIDALLVDTTLMNVTEVGNAVARVVRARDIARTGGNRVSKIEGSTSGHLFRGV